MHRNELASLLRPMIEQGKTKEVLEALSQFVRGVDRYAENDLLLQTSAFNRNVNDFRSGLITKGDYDIAMARLNYAITHIMDRLPDLGNEPGNLNITQTVQASISEAQKGVEKEEKKKRKILFLAANPDDTGRIDLDREYRKVKDELMSSTKRDNFELISEPAIQVKTMTMAMQVHHPNIVHFSGHGEGEKGLALQDESGQKVLFPTKGLDRLFRIFKKNVECVVLNACYSKEQAETISMHGIYVVGMKTAIQNNAGVDFSVGFYQSLGEGNDYEFAFEIGMITISHHLRDSNAPELWYDGKIISS